MLDVIDLGDWIGAEGEVITSRRGELSIDVQGLWLLAKALRPLPDKWHGLTATDTRYRQREVDLLANPDSRRVFDIRFRTIGALRRVMVEDDFVEVDTPILQPQAGGALARPFLTHANALDMDLSLRIAPELYLKRLVVGGYERVFEIARNFRNEGIDTRHSPEFTALEAYQAFGDLTEGMDLTERLVVAAAEAATGRLTYEIAGRAARPDAAVAPAPAARLARGGGRPPAPPHRPGRGRPGGVRGARRGLPAGVGLRQADLRALRHRAAARSVTDPVMVVGFPVEVSPLARASADDPTMADRFELCIDAREFANGYSELNVPEEQQARFQARPPPSPRGTPRRTRPTRPSSAPSSTACRPTSGIGLGVDRLVMLLAEVEAIRDVILFPVMRPESGI